MSKPKRPRPKVSGAPTPHAERQDRLKETRVDVYLPEDIAEDLSLLVDHEAALTGLRPERCRTAAISRAIREAAARVRKRQKLA